jgi:hypothetical protein
MLEEVILVDAHDTHIGTMEKLEAHEKGLLHRAFSILNSAHWKNTIRPDYGPTLVAVTLVLMKRTLRLPIDDYKKN